MERYELDELRRRAWRAALRRAQREAGGITHGSEILRVLRDHGGGEMKRVDIFRASPTMWASVQRAIAERGGHWPISTGPEHALDRLRAAGLVERTRWAYYRLVEKKEKETQHG